MTDFTFQLHIERKSRWESCALRKKVEFLSTFAPFPTLCFLPVLSRCEHRQWVREQRVYTYVTKQWKSNKISLLLMQSDGDDDILLCYDCEQQLSVSFICIIIIETQIIRRSAAESDWIQFVWFASRVSNIFECWGKKGGIIFIGNILVVCRRWAHVFTYASDVSY